MNYTQLYTAPFQHYYNYCHAVRDDPSKIFAFFKDRPVIKGNDLILLKSSIIMIWVEHE